MSKFSIDVPDNPITNSKPAPYPTSAKTELDAVSLFNYLLNKTHIKGEAKSLDKNPNGDGILEYTNEMQIPLGRFEVQVKTLQKKNYQNPKYQCEKTFLSHCHHTNLPVILIVVNVNDKMAYWLHIDAKVIRDAGRKIKKESLAITLPKENVITKDEIGYLAKWEQIILDDAETKRENAALKIRQSEMEAELVGIREKLGPQLTLSTSEIRVFQNFIDEFNRLLDFEFKAVKRAHYPDYWKIGVGIVQKSNDSVAFFLLPIQYGSNDLVIRQLKESDSDIHNYFFDEHRALMYLDRTFETLEQNPGPQSYNLLKSEILRVVKDERFPLPDAFLANEFVSSFVSNFSVWLGIDEQNSKLSLDELRILITTILPVAIESSFSYIAEWVTHQDHSIDSYKERRPHPIFRKRIDEAREKLRLGYRPKVQITLSSKIYPINLLLYYINFLIAQGKNEIVEVYVGGQTRFQNVNLMPSGWNRPVLHENLKRFFTSFPRLYRDYVRVAFPLLTQELELFENCQLILFVIRSTGISNQRPHLQCYRMEHEDKSLFLTDFLLDTDPENPVTENNGAISWENPYIDFKGTTFKVKSVSGMAVEFMFQPLPTYALIHKYLEEKMSKYLRSKIEL
ncbi:DUF4365 domain-containing protein [Mucilaginibacter flavus]|uniref:DUF4365 domain-containing protein n=1 Tax=Mucilaginibacter flavus TaxID=931504 RepID=UPI0025B3CB87|nr:DUF4365 domain-containing protein [Mucilaginibacter flavus]MDN3582105.1 DUF4365 domain-containing protein [Mucilaginibacter flavus]